VLLSIAGQAVPMSELFEQLSDFDGLVHQIRRRVPNTLSLDELENHNRVRVLVENGLCASFYLPHTGVRVVRHRRAFHDGEGSRERGGSEV
jgi:hypothetical protein